MAESSVEKLDPVRNPGEWDRLYQCDDPETLPWTTHELDPDIADALTRVSVAGRVLDIGCGAGTQSLALAKRGFRVVGADVSHAAVAHARDRALRAGVDVEFVQDDVTATRLRGTFAALIDRGCFHVLPPESRPAYVASVSRLAEPGAWFLHKCFSFMEERTDGPHRFTRAEICQLFEPAFEVIGVADTIFHGQLSPPPKALFSVLRRAP